MEQGGELVARAADAEDEDAEPAGVDEPQGGGIHDHAVHGRVVDVPLELAAEAAHAGDVELAGDEGPGGPP